MRKLIPLLVVVLFGCGKINPGKNPDPVEITGSVTQGGKPVSDVVLNLQATGTGGQAAITVANGAFKGSVIPGKYTYYISEGQKATAFRAIPEKYRAGSIDRQIDVEAGSKLTIVLD